MAETCAGWVDKGSNHFACQFGDEAAEHVFSGAAYCRFHLPMGEVSEGGKAGWEDGACPVESVGCTVVSTGSVVGASRVR